MIQITALIPTQNGADHIEATILALLEQSRPIDHIVVIPNGCTDDTAAIARKFESQGVIVLELPKLPHRKAEALNTAWNEFSFVREADIIAGFDDDTDVPPNAIADWERELLDHIYLPPLPNAKPLDQPIAGLFGRVTMRGGNFFTRLQRLEFCRWSESSLARGWGSVLSGTGCAISGEALRRIAAYTDRPGPWSHDTQVEDYELTYQIRKLGYRCKMSPSVRIYTDSMKNVKTLWRQRMKWQVGTIEELTKWGLNRLTFIDWIQQSLGLLVSLWRFIWVFLMIFFLTQDALRFSVLWLVVVPLATRVEMVVSSLRIPHRDRMDVFLAATLVADELFAWLRSAWIVRAWFDVLVGRLTGKRPDRWQDQYAAEGKV